VHSAIPSPPRARGLSKRAGKHVAADKARRAVAIQVTTLAGRFRRQNVNVRTPLFVTRHYYYASSTS
jgi:hypothetical protein